MRGRSTCWTTEPVNPLTFIHITPLICVCTDALLYYSIYCHPVYWRASTHQQWWQRIKWTFKPLQYCFKNLFLHQIFTQLQDRGTFYLIFKPGFWHFRILKNFSDSYHHDTEYSLGLIRVEAGYGRHLGPNPGCWTHRRRSIFSKFFVEASFVHHWKWEELNETQKSRAKVGFSNYFLWKKETILSLFTDIRTTSNNLPLCFVLTKNSKGERGN